jgi:hypothetical protein
VRRFKNAIDELGWVNGCAYLLARLLGVISLNRVVLRKYYFVAQPVAPKPWLSPRRGNSIVVARVLADDPIVQRFPRPAEVIAARFAQQGICLVATKAEQFIGFLWLTLGPHQEDEVRCRYVPLPENRTAWDFDVYLHPEHRTGIAFLKLWDAANEFLAARDIAWSLSRISAFNGNSINSHGKMGARRIGAALFLSVGNWQLSCASVSPQVFFSTRRDRFPNFALDARQGADRNSAD